LKNIIFTLQKQTNFKIFLKIQKIYKKLSIEWKYNIRKMKMKKKNKIIKLWKNQKNVTMKKWKNL
jgi:hypothetical protein